MVSAITPSTSKATDAGSIIAGGTGWGRGNKPLAVMGLYGVLKNRA
ncbi:MAG: hypothetical protein HY895_09290 [Deltaproteobacteria bacterium]|nr:hypothetical protein [Deltaproteobacteria bacterium]